MDVEPNIATDAPMEGISDNATDAPMKDATDDPMDVNIHDDVMDKAVLESVPYTPIMLEISPVSLVNNLSLLLVSIASTSGEMLDPKYRDYQTARDLINAQPGLKEKLQTAWINGKFTEIRNLGANIGPRVRILLTFVLGAEILRARPKTAVGVPVQYSMQTCFVP